METSRLHPDCDLTLAALHWANGGRVTRWYTPQGGVWLPDYFEPYSHDADPPPSPDVCPRFRGLYLFDRITSAIIRLGCNRYSCDVCGKRLRRRLRRYLEAQMKEVAAVRMWTFTLTSRKAADPAEHYQQLRRAWRYFLTALRRSHIFTPEERQCRFIGVVEHHQSGFWHLHVLVDRWMDWYRVQTVWERAAQRAVDSERHAGFCWVKWLSKRNAVRYIVKYITKASAELQRKQKRWTRSRGWQSMKEALPPRPGEWVIARVSPISGELLLKGEATSSHELTPEALEEVLSHFCTLRKWYFWATDRSPPDAG